MQRAVFFIGKSRTFMQRIVTRGVMRSAGMQLVLCVAFGTNTLAAQTAKPKESVVITDAWARPALRGGTGGVYMTITNSGATAVRISRATSLDAKVVELHESSEHNGMAHMQMLSAIELAPGASTTLKTGSKHFMLIGLRRAFVAGDTMRVVLLVETVQTASSPKPNASRARVVTARAAVRVP